MVDILIFVMYIALTLALGSAIWSICRKIRVVGKTSGKVHGIPMRAVIIVIAVVLVSLLAVTFFAADVPADSSRYSEAPTPFWLRISNMMVVTSIIIFYATIATMGYSICHSARLAGKTLIRQLFCDIFVIHRRHGKPRRKHNDTLPRTNK